MEPAHNESLPSPALPITLMAIGVALCFLSAYVAVPIPYWVFWSGIILQTVTLIILFLRRKLVGITGFTPFFFPVLMCLFTCLVFVLPKLPRKIEQLRIQSQKNDELKQILNQAREHKTQ